MEMEVKISLFEIGKLHLHDFKRKKSKHVIDVQGQQVFFLEFHSSAEVRSSSRIIPFGM